MKVIAVFALSVLCFASVAMAASGQQLAFDHASIMVTLRNHRETPFHRAGLSRRSPDSRPYFRLRQQG